MPDSGAPFVVENYSYLASAIAGRRMAVYFSSAQESLAFCDGQAIQLSRRREVDFDVAQLEVVAQALLVAAGSLSVSVMQRLLGRPQAARRYAYLEVRRALRMLEFRIPHAFALHSELAIDFEVMTLSADASASYALDGRRALPPIPDFIGSVRPFPILRNWIAHEGLDALTVKQQQGKFDRDEELPPAYDDDTQTESSSILKMLKNPLMGRNPLSDMLNKIFGMGASRGNRSESPDTSGGSEMPIARIARAWQRGVNAVKAVLPFELAALDAGAAVSQFSYPEWDEFKQQYRKDWVAIHEVDPWSQSGPRDLAIVLTPPPQELQRQLASLGLGYEMHRRQIDGTEFDVGRLIECAIDLKTGHSPTALDVYRASRKTRRDLGVMIVVDISGSTEEKNAKGESMLDHHLRAAWHLAQTFHRLGDRVALYGFQSWGRKLVHMVRLKGHEENWSSRIAERLSLLEPVGFTRTGAAIRHADHVLQTSMRLPNRLLILITDGFSYDQDYEENYAEGDARKALQEARAKGTACVCLCIGDATSTEQLGRVFGAANLLTIDDSSQLLGRIPQVCRDALHAVSKRKVMKVQKKLVA